MANSRKDSRGYVLRTGESQRKDGRYSYSFTDLEGKRRCIYAKTLVELRTKERKIIRDKEDGLDSNLAERMTLNQLYDDPGSGAAGKYVGQYQHAAASGVSDGSEGWTPIITVLLGTGMRIGECIGLRWEDLDFENRMISVDHTLIYRLDEKGVSAKHISMSKTLSGVRTIPMIDEVFDTFLQEYELQKCIGYSSETIDGYSDFVFATATGSVYSAASVNKAIERSNGMLLSAVNNLKDSEDEELHLLMVDNHIPAGAKLY